MLYFIAIWIGLFAVCLTVGCGWLHWLQAGRIDRTGDRVAAALWLGLVILAISVLAVAIFVPLSPLAGTVAAAPWLLLALKSPAVRTELSQWASKLSYGLLLMYGLCSAVIAAVISQKVTWLDTGQYHYGLIRWFAEYGVTPGLVLLNPQFGFVSAWFALTAPFDVAAFEGRVGPVLNGFILLVTVLQIAIALSRIARSRARLSDWFSLIFLSAVCILLVRTPLLAVITRSPSPDSAIALLTVAVAWSILIVGTAAEGDDGQEIISGALIPLVLSVGAVSIKLTALPLLPIAFGFYLLRGVRHISPSVCLKRLGAAGLLTFLLLLPFLASEVLVSGCPLYPATTACLDLPWTKAAADTQQLAASTHGWGRWFGQPPSGANRTLWLIQQWIASNSSSRLITILILASACSIAYLLRLFLTRKLSNQFYSLFWLTVLAIVGTAFMMLKAPLFRFGMGYALLLPVLSISILGNAWTQQWGSLPTKFLLRPLRRLEYSLLSVGAFWAIALSGQAYGGLGDRLLTPPPLPTVKIEIQQANQITYFVSQDKRDQCWSADLPCVNSIRSEVQLRNPQAGLRGGFTVEDSP